jgi:hypothetical protein
MARLHSSQKLSLLLKEGQVTSLRLPVVRTSLSLALPMLRTSVMVDMCGLQQTAEPMISGS